MRPRSPPDVQKISPSKNTFSKCGCEIKWNMIADNCTSQTPQENKVTEFLCQKSYNCFSNMVTHFSRWLPMLTSCYLFHNDLYKARSYVNVDTLNLT